MLISLEFIKISNSSWVCKTKNKEIDINIQGLTISKKEPTGQEFDMDIFHISLLIG